MRAPFPWFGGKSRVADLVWARFGDVPNYVVPFAGSLAVLLERPHEPKTETVNDLDCYLSNFWRALQAEPEAVARWADWPVNEADLHARHWWLVRQAGFRERMRDDPDYYAAYLVTHILGGGGFSSRLTEEVREKRGLAYSTYAALQDLHRSSLVMAGVSTRNDAVSESVDIIQAAGATLSCVVIALDRQERGTGTQSAIQEVEQAWGITVASIITLADLLEYLRGQPGQDPAVTSIETYREAYGV